MSVRGAQDDCDWGLITQRVHIHYYYGIKSQNHNGDGLLGANSIIVVYMDPLGLVSLSFGACFRNVLLASINR